MGSAIELTLRNRQAQSGVATLSDARRPESSPIELTLRYTHSLGGLAPYFEGLAAGHAVAAHCPLCGRTWFPPRLGCCSQAGPVRWTTLVGKGRIVAGTTGGGSLPFGGGPAGEGLALIALDGADNLALGWVDGLGDVPPEGARVRLVTTGTRPPHPAQAARFVPE